MMATLCMKGFEISQLNVSSKKIIENVNKHYKILVKIKLINQSRYLLTSISWPQNDGYEEFCSHKDS